MKHVRDHCRNSALLCEILKLFVLMVLKTSSPGTLHVTITPSCASVVIGPFSFYAIHRGGAVISSVGVGLMYQDIVIIS